MPSRRNTIWVEIAGTTTDPVLSDTEYDEHHDSCYNPAHCKKSSILQGSWPNLLLIVYVS